MGKLGSLHAKDDRGLHKLHEVSEALQANSKHQILDPLAKKGKK
jgi:hypothetical protein